MHPSRFQKNESIRINVWVLQNQLQVDKSKLIIYFFLLSS
jgi:hypothetical protein